MQAIKAGLYGVPIPILSVSFLIRIPMNFFLFLCVNFEPLAKVIRSDFCYLTLEKFVIFYCGKFFAILSYCLIFFLLFQEFCWKYWLFTRKKDFFKQFKSIKYKLWKSYFTYTKIRSFKCIISILFPYII